MLKPVFGMANFWPIVCLQVAEGGCSSRRNRYHLADGQDQDLTGRFGASNPASRPSQVGQQLTLAGASWVPASDWVQPFGFGG